MSPSTSRSLPPARPAHPALEALIGKSVIARPLALGRFPTRLEPRPDFASSLGRDVYLKREDEADALGCGHKLRKLSFLLPPLIESGVNVLVTAGSVPSNQCKSVAWAAKVCGLRAHVAFLGDREERPAAARGNYLLTALLGCDVTWLEHCPWTEAEVRLKAIMEDERTKGAFPALLAPGLSENDGLLGSLEAGLETATDLAELNPRRVVLVAAAGSGGTCLGLKLAAELLGLPYRVYGCLIGETLVTVSSRIAALRNAFQRRFGWGGEDDGRLILTDVALGLGYNRPQLCEIKAMREALSSHGLLFDLNYMVKTYIGFQKLVAAGAIRHGDVVVLVHTGGQMGLFDESPALSNWLEENLPHWTKVGRAVPAAAASFAAD